MIRAEAVARGPAPWLHVERVEDPRAFERLRPEWDALMAESDAALFNAREWLEPWHRILGADRTVHLLAARDPRGRLAGLMPLGLQRIRVAGRRLRRLGFLGETHVGSDYLDVIARPGEREAVAQRFALWLREHRDAWDVIELLDVDDHTPTLAAFRRVFSADPFQLRFTHRFVCPWEAFEPGESFDAFLRRTGRRQNYLRRRRWLEAQPGFAIERAETPDAIVPALDDFFRLHALRWDAAGGSMGITGPEVEAFHRDALGALAARGHARLYTLRVGGDAVASVYGLVHRDTFLYYQAGYDPRWRDKSVGLVLVGETFADALRSGLRAFDFLRGVEPYKAEWTSRRRFTLGLRIWARGGAGAWLTRTEDAEEAARAWVRGALPPWLLGRIRAVRSRGRR